MIKGTGQGCPPRRQSHVALRIKVHGHWLAKSNRNPLQFTPLGCPPHTHTHTHTHTHPSSHISKSCPINLKCIHHFFTRRFSKLNPAPSLGSLEDMPSYQLKQNILPHNLMCRVLGCVGLCNPLEEMKVPDDGEGFFFEGFFLISQ